MTDTLRQRGSVVPPDDLSVDQRNRFVIWSRRHAPLVRAAEYHQLPLAVVQRAVFVRHLINEGKLHDGRL